MSSSTSHYRSGCEACRLKREQTELLISTRQENQKLRALSQKKPFWKSVFNSLPSNQLPLKNPALEKKNNYPHIKSKYLDIFQKKSNIYSNIK